MMNENLYATLKMLGASDEQAHNAASFSLEFTTTKADLVEMKSDLDSQIKDLDGKIKDLKVSLVQWMILLLIASDGLLIAFIANYFPR